MNTWPLWQCTGCGDALREGESGAWCAREGLAFSSLGPVRLLLKTERRAQVAPRVAAYRQLRHEEGWRAQPGLPEVPIGHPFHAIWSRRARHLAAALDLLERRLPTRPWDVLDVGAGSGWLSARLLAQGHRVAAIDLNLDPDDGLLAADRLLDGGATLPRAEAEMERLPLPDAAFDCVVAAASLHHAADPIRALMEMRRVVRPGGLVLVMDTPIFRLARDGDAMRRARSLPTGEAAAFFTREGLLTVFRAAGLTPSIHGWPARWCEEARDGLERLRWGRRTARFPLFLGTHHA